MGMYTSIMHEGKEHQIKTGRDHCLRYRVGDKIPWELDFNSPGHHVDDVYDACGWGTPDSWVVIKDCVVVAVLPRESDDEHAERAELMARYGITEPPREWWPEAAWDAKADQDAKYDAEHAAEYAAWAAENGDNPFGFFMHQWMHKKSFAATLFPSTKADQDAPRYPSQYLK